MRFFNTAGASRPDDHYCIPPLERLALDGVRTLIQQKSTSCYTRRVRLASRRYAICSTPKYMDR